MLISFVSCVSTLGILRWYFRISHQRAHTWEQGPEIVVISVFSMRSTRVLRQCLSKGEMKRGENSQLEDKLKLIKHYRAQANRKSQETVLFYLQTPPCIRPQTLFIQSSSLMYSQGPTSLKHQACSFKKKQQNDYALDLCSAFYLAFISKPSLTCFLPVACV